MCELKIVGVTRTSCNCFEPDSINPLSGLYLSELEGFNLQKVLDTEDCERGQWEQITDKALEQAYTLTHSEVLRLINESNDFEKRPKINGLLGKEDKAKFYGSGKTHIVFRMLLNNLKDTKIKIDQITTMFRDSGNVSISVYNPFLQPVATIQLTVNGGVLQKHTLTSPILLNCDVKGVKHSQYFFVYSTNLKPMMFNYKCCGDSYKFDCNNPYFDFKASWRQLINFGYNQVNYTGISDLEKLRCECAECDYIPGMMFNIESTCDMSKLTCNTDIDYMDDFGLSLALAIRYKAAGIIYTDILNRNSPEKVNPEDMLAAISLWDVKFSQHCEFIAQSPDVLQYSGCFKTKETMIKRRAV